MHYLTTGPQGYDSHPACYPVAATRFWDRHAVCDARPSAIRLRDDTDDAGRRVAEPRRLGPDAQ
jgi:hypothetical protein